MPSTPKETTKGLMPSEQIKAQFEEIEANQEEDSKNPYGEPPADEKTGGGDEESAVLDQSF